jgi:hypothetical protein
MLAMADRKGRVWASIPGLANRSRVSVESAQKAINKFLGPDPFSRTPDHEGRRIEVIDGGWRLLNYQKYRDVRDEESVKESKRRYISNRRASEKQQLTQNVENVEQCRTLSIQAEAEAEADNIHTHASRSVSANEDQVLSVYNAYPKKVAKPNALRAIKKALQKVPFATLLALTQEYAQLVANKERQYIPHPASWFNSEGYNDNDVLRLENARWSDGQTTAQPVRENTAPPLTKPIHLMTDAERHRLLAANL